MIPKLFHFVWIGDDRKRPTACIKSWKRHNPDWEVVVWNNDDLSTREWVNKHHMRSMHELKGIANLMRFEILHRYGGFALDADSVCYRQLDPWFNECTGFSCWENEYARSGLISAGYMACEEEDMFVGKLIYKLSHKTIDYNAPVWQTCGTLTVTEHFFEQQPDWTILPSHFFIPQHYTGRRYNGKGPIYGDQLWADTLNIDASQWKKPLTDTKQPKS